MPFLLHYHTVHTAQGLARSIDEMRGLQRLSGRVSERDAAAAVLARRRSRGPPSSICFPASRRWPWSLAGLVVARRDRRFQFYAGAAAVMTALAVGPAAERAPLAVLWHPYSLAHLAPGLQRPARADAHSTCWRCCAWRSPPASRSSPSLRRAHGCASRWPRSSFAGLVADGAIAGMPLGSPPGDLALEARNARVLVLPYRGRPAERVRDVPLDVAPAAGRERLRGLHPAARPT